MGIVITKKDNDQKPQYKTVGILVINKETDEVLKEYRYRFGDYAHKEKILNKAVSFVADTYRVIPEIQV